MILHSHPGGCQQLERARAAQRARERIAEKDAEAFWAEQRAAQGYAASQIFGPTQTERDADREIDNVGEYNRVHNASFENPESAGILPARSSTQ